MKFKNVMKRLRRSRRAVSPVIAVLLMIVIAVAASLFAYSWVSGYLDFLTVKVDQGVQVQTINWNNETQTLTAYAQNVGPNDVNIANVYVDDVLDVTAMVYVPGTTDEDWNIPAGDTRMVVSTGIYTGADNQVTVKLTTEDGNIFMLKKTITTTTSGGGPGPTPPPTVTRVQYEVTGFGVDPTGTWDAQPAEGDLLVAISGTRVTGANPVITSAGWTRAHVEASYHTDSSHRRVVAIWYKIAGASESLDVDFNWDSGASDTAFVILQEFTGASSWTFVDADGNDNGMSTGTTLDIPSGTISAGGNDNILAIPGMTFRGEVPTVTFTSENIGNVIKNTMDTDNDGISGWVYTTAGDMDWATTATWTGPREASGLLALFSCS